MNNNYNIIRIQQYLNGSLSERDMHDMERQALSDPLLHEAIEGYRERSEIDHGKLSLLQQRLATRVALKQEKRDAFYFGWQRLSIAATAGVMLVLVLVLLWMRNTQYAREEATHKEVEVLRLDRYIGVSPQAGTAKEFDATPVAGWEAYNSYLAESRPEKVEKGTGPVTLSFSVDGEGKPFATKIVGKAKKPFADEAVRLLTEGPTWTGKRGQVVFTFVGD